MYILPQKLLILVISTSRLCYTGSPTVFTWPSSPRRTCRRAPCQESGGHRGPLQDHGVCVHGGTAAGRPVSFCGCINFYSALPIQKYIFIACRIGDHLMCNISMYLGQAMIHSPPIPSHTLFLRIDNSIQFPVIVKLAVYVT